jgi:hypothetical protein
MRTRMTIMAIVLAAAAVAVGAIALLAIMLGWLGLAIMERRMLKGIRSRATTGLIHTARR